MKLLYRVSIPVVAALFMISCVDLDTYPEGANVTADQKKKVVETMPDRIMADVNALVGTLTSEYIVFGDQYRADDLGFVSNMITNDLEGPDMGAPDDGYNWFSVAGDYSNRTYSFANPRIQWDNMYKTIFAANSLLLIIDPETETTSLLPYRGMALAIRAFAYFQLAQRYQFTYIGNQDKPCVPLVLAEVELKDLTYNPRATVQEVYDVIMSDLNTAVTLLEGYTRTNKQLIDQQVALGIRARVNLVMNNWSDAYSDAQAAMAGYTPYSIEDVSKPSFNNISANSWIWGMIFTPDMIYSGLQCWASKMVSFVPGYTAQVGMYKFINKPTWDMIPSTDVRKGWWVDEDLKSPNSDDLRWPGEKWVDIPVSEAAISGTKVPFLPYTNVKFGPYQDEIGNSTGAGDVPLMRAEEMLLIMAEAKARGGDLPGAKSELEDFVKTYRNASFTSTAGNLDQFINEVWFQRRIELWGEGFANLDMYRLKRNLVRFSATKPSNFPEAFTFNLPATDVSMLLNIPQAEINANRGIPQSENNGGVGQSSRANPGLSDGGCVF